MLTKDELASLAVGDMIEAGEMLAGITKEPIVLRVTTTGEAVVFVATYFGVSLGKVTASGRGEAIQWVMA